MSPEASSVYRPNENSQVGREKEYLESDVRDLKGESGGGVGVAGWRGGGGRRVWIVTLPCAADGKSIVQNCVYEMLSFCLKGKSLYTYLCLTMPKTFLGEY